MLAKSIFQFGDLYLKFKFLQSVLEKQWETEDGKVEKIKDTLELQGVYPRWMGSGNISYSPEDITKETKYVNSLFYLGDTKKEIELGVAPGFPQVPLEFDEIIVSEIFAKYFGFDLNAKEGSKDYPIGKVLKLEFDFLKLLDM